MSYFNYPPNLPQIAISCVKPLIKYTKKSVLNLAMSLIINLRELMLNSHNIIDGSGFGEREMLGILLKYFQNEFYDSNVESFLPIFFKHVKKDQTKHLNI